MYTIVIHSLQPSIICSSSHLVERRWQRYSLCDWNLSWKMSFFSINIRVQLNMNCKRKRSKSIVFEQNISATPIVRLALRKSSLQILCFRKEEEEEKWWFGLIALIDTNDSLFLILPVLITNRAYQVIDWFYGNKDKKTIVWLIEGFVDIHRACNKITNEKRIFLPNNISNQEKNEFFCLKMKYETSFNLLMI